MEGNHILSVLLSYMFVCSFNSNAVYLKPLPGSSSLHGINGYFHFENSMPLSLPMQNQFFVDNRKDCANVLAKCATNMFAI